jgi:hypothetical protein
VAFSITSTGSKRIFLVFLLEKPDAWIPSNAGCWKLHGKRSKMPACPRTSFGARIQACLLACPLSEFATIAQDNPRGMDVHTNGGIALSIAANRISFFLDLRGPSLAVNTACSSSLVALHLACESMWTGESEMALSGGVNTIFTPSGTIGFSKAGMLSPEGECYAFDARANGFARS